MSNLIVSVREKGSPRHFSFDSLVGCKSKWVRLK